MLKRTPLYEAHVKLDARLVEFGGWEMPVQYSSIVDEHQAVRRAAGLFDISHMGEIVVSGTGAAEFLNSVLTNDVARLEIGQAQYTLMCNPSGGVIDDLYVYRLTDRDYLLIVNASRIDADWDWLQAQYDQSRVGRAIDLQNVSTQLGALAIQGPRTVEFIDAAVQDGSMGSAMVDKVTALKKNELGVFVFAGHSIYVARTGYTGEDGFEVVAPAAILRTIWDRVLAAGHAACLQPAGLGARDTLRTEMGYPLYGHELNEQTSPLEAGLGAFVALNKGEFIGREPLAAQKASGIRRKGVAFTMQGKTPPPRPDYPLWTVESGGEQIGVTTSGTHSPSLNTGIGLGYVPTEYAKAGTALYIEIRGRRYPAVVVPKPIYRRAGV